MRLNIRKIFLLTMVFAFTFTLHPCPVPLWFGASPFTLMSAYAGTKGADPVAYWRFDEGGGPTAYDDTANNNDGTLVNHTKFVPGKIGKALQFDGTDDYVSVPDSNNWTFGTGSFSIAFWVKLNEASPASRKPIISSGTTLTNDNDTFAFYQSNGGKWEISLYQTNKGWTYSSASDTTNWHHIAIVRESGINDIYVFVDGIQLSGTVLSGNWGVISSLNINWPGVMFGRSWDPGYFNGLIDDVRIYNYARTADQIKVDYNAGSAAHLAAGVDPNEGNPSVGYWTLDENTGTTAYDRSGNGNSGTITDATWAQGHNGSCLSFDGSGDYVVSGTTLLNNQTTQTITAWIYINSLPTAGNLWQLPTIVSKGDVYINFGYNESGKLFGYYYNSSGTPVTSIQSSSSMTTGKWYHVAWTWNATATKLYINGIQEYSGTNIGPGYNLHASHANGAVRFGLSPSNPPQGVIGRIDEIKIYNYERTPAQIAYDYNKGMPVAQYRFDEGGGTIAKNDYSSADSGVAPVGWWRMDAGSGTSAIDSSGNGNTGTLGTSPANPTWSTSSKIGPYALSFDGVNDYVQISNPSAFNFGANDFTISMWFNLSALPADINPLFNFDKATGHQAANYGIDVSVNSAGGLVSYFSDGTHEIYCSISSVTLNTWHYFVMTRNGSTLRCYLDAVAGTDGNVSTYTLNYDANFQANIASRYNGYNFAGTRQEFIDDVRIYNYSRTAEQIYNDYKTTHGTLVGDTKFVDGKIGKALQFDGSGDYVNACNNASLENSTAITVAAWIKYSSSVSEAGIAGKSPGIFNSGYMLRIRNNYLGFWLNKDDGSYYDIFDYGPQLNDNNWHYVAGTFDTSKLKLYIDGKFVGETNTGTGYRISNSNLLIGYNAPYSAYFTGLIDDVRIYSYARTASQVMEDYDSGAARIGGQSAGEADPWGGALPVGYWKMDENTGVLANDASGNGNNGTLTNGPTWAQGKVGPCLNFDGTDDYVAIPYNPIFDFGTNLWTIGGWINTKSPTTDQSLIEWGSYLANGFLFRLNEPNGVPPKFMIYIGGASYTWNYTFTANTWYHLMIRRNNSTTVEAFVNGISQGTLTIPSGTTITAGGGAAWIGKMTSGGGATTWSGLLDDVRIYNYARTQAQIAWDYNKGQPVGYWRFDEASGTACYDDSGNNNGTATIGATGSQGDIATARTNGATGKFGKCMSFDGTDDYVTLASSANWNFGTTDFSVELWFKTPSITGGYSIPLSKMDTGGGWYVELTITYASFYSENNNILSYSINPVDNQWHHLVGVRTVSGNTASRKIYFDGVLRNSDTKTAVSVTNTKDLNIGKYSLSPGYYFTGLIDDVRIYNYARTDDQVKQDYNAGAATRLGD